MQSLSRGSLRFADHHYVACSCAARADEITAIARKTEVPDLFGLEVSQLLNGQLFAGRIAQYGRLSVSLPSR